MEGMVLIAAVIGGLLLGLIILFSTRYVRCPSNRILAVYGMVGGTESVKCYHGGAKFVIPLLQEAKFLDLTPITINIDLKGALSLQNIRINVPSTFTIAIDPSPQNINTAAIRLLGLSQKEIEGMAMEILFGQLRLTVASLTIEEINQDRERFLTAIRNNVETELSKIGMALINVNITDITDASGYIDSIGKKAASTAVNQAKVDVAEQEKLGEIGSSQADMERRISVADYNAKAVEGENRSKAEIAGYDAELAERSAEANQRGEVARERSRAEIERARAQAEQQRLEVEQVVPEIIKKRQVEIVAEAEAERERKEAQGRADALLQMQTAEAEGQLKILGAKTKYYRDLLAATNNDAQAAVSMLLIEKLEEVVKLQAEAIKQVKIDNVTVWDSGSSNGDDSSSTSRFVSSMVKNLPPLHDVVQMAGLKLPDYMGSFDNGHNLEHREASTSKDAETADPVPTAETGTAVARRAEAPSKAPAKAPRKPAPKTSGRSQKGGSTETEGSSK